MSLKSAGALKKVKGILSLLTSANAAGGLIEAYVPEGMMTQIKPALRPISVIAQAIQPLITSDGTVVSIENGSQVSTIIQREMGNLAHLWVNGCQIEEIRVLESLVAKRKSELESLSSS